MLPLSRMRTRQVLPSLLLPLLMTAEAVAVAKPWFFVPLRVETRYPNGVPHRHHHASSGTASAGKEGVGVDSWAFVGSRNDPADDRENRCESARGRSQF